MLNWYDSQIARGEQRARGHGGYVRIRPAGSNVRSVEGRRVFASAAQAKALSERVAAEAQINARTVKPRGLGAVSFQRDARDPKVWSGVVGHHRERSYVAHVAEIEQPNGVASRWLPLVEADSMIAFDQPQAAMEYAAVAAGQRLLHAQQQAHRGERYAARMARRAQFSTAISRDKATMPVRYLNGREIRAAQILAEIGFTRDEVARGLKIDATIVADICQRDPQAAYERWAGQSSDPGRRPTPTPAQPTKAEARVGDTVGERCATTFIKADQVKVAFHARAGGMIDAHVPSRRGHDSMRVEIMQVSRDGQRHWQAKGGGRRLGPPRSNMHDAAISGIHHARDYMAGYSARVSVAPATDPRERQLLAEQARQVERDRVAGEPVGRSPDPDQFKPKPGPDLDRIQASDRQMRDAARHDIDRVRSLYRGHRSVISDILVGQKTREQSMDSC